MSSKLSGVGLSVFTAGESGWADAMNANLLALDAMTQPRVISRSLSVPPASPQVGDLYIVATAPTGAWSGKTNQLALYDGAAWLFYTPKKGWLVFVLSESKYYWFDENWMPLQVESPTADFDEDGVRNTTLDGLEQIEASGSVIETDTVLSAIAKFRAQISTLTAPPNYGDVTDVGGEGYYPFSQSDGVLYTTSQTITIQPGFYRIAAAGAYASASGGGTESGTSIRRTLTSELYLSASYDGSGGTQRDFSSSAPITTPAGQSGKKGWLDFPNSDFLRYLFSNAPDVNRGANALSVNGNGAHSGYVAISKILHFVEPTQLTLTIGVHYDSGTFDMATAGTGFVWIREVPAP